MTPCRSQSFKHCNSAKHKQVFHTVKAKPLSLLLESVHPPPVANVHAELEVTDFGQASGTPDTTIPKIGISNRAPSWSPITRPSAQATGAIVTIPASSQSAIATAQSLAAQPPLSKTSLRAPSWSLIPPPADGTTPIKTNILRDGLAGLERMQVQIYGDDALENLEEWDKQIGWVAFVGPCHLPSLKELGLNVLYEAGQMGAFSWREKCFGMEEGVEGRLLGWGGGGGRDNDGGKGVVQGSTLMDRGCGGDAENRFGYRDDGGFALVGGDGGGPESMVSWKRDFWSVVM